jgi:sensor histidine kinase YesM
MLEAFVDYLRASLDKIRRDVAPLESELALAEAYLRLLSTRMEERLRYEIDVGEGLRQVPLPPLLLQPLVENAVQHGLEPKIEGGTVNIRARAEGPTLVLEVSDDGLGPQASAGRNGVAGNGLAMDNIRARLQSRYGSDASLALSANIAGAGGTRATLRLPIEPPAIA